VTSALEARMCRRPELPHFLRLPEVGLHESRGYRASINASGGGRSPPSGAFCFAKCAAIVDHGLPLPQVHRDVRRQQQISGHWTVGSGTAASHPLPHLPRWSRASCGNTCARCRRSSPSCLARPERPPEAPPRESRPPSLGSRSPAGRRGGSPSGSGRYPGANEYGEVPW
jgi:hypothetical protein